LYALGTQCIDRANELHENVRPYPQMLGIAQVWKCDIDQASSKVAYMICVTYCEVHEETSLIPKLNPTVCMLLAVKPGQTVTRKHATTDASLQSKGTDSNLMKRLRLTLCKYKSEISNSVRFQPPIHSVHAFFALHRCSPVFHVLIRIRRPTLISRTQPLTTSLFV
jgi:hypothetical protein